MSLIITSRVLRFICPELCEKKQMSISCEFNHITYTYLEQEPFKYVQCCLGKLCNELVAHKIYICANSCKYKWKWLRPWCALPAFIPICICVCVKWLHEPKHTGLPWICRAIQQSKNYSAASAATEWHQMQQYGIFSITHCHKQ